MPFAVKAIMATKQPTTAIYAKPAAFRANLMLLIAILVKVQEETTISNPNQPTAAS